MRSETIAVQQVFQDRRQYRVPFYQRAYVWNREDQWESLATDILDKADARLLGSPPVSHFLGAVVLEPQQREGLIGVETLHIIDGQQRLTTLQYVLAALAIVLRANAEPALLSIVESCQQNSNPQTMQNVDVEVYKVWPTFRDRTQYRQALSAQTLDELRETFSGSFTQQGNLKKIGVEHPPALEAIWFFQEKFCSWANQGGTAECKRRLQMLTEAVLRDLSVVSITLGEDDDAQIIFETLNGRGARLHATDLIRNFIFMRADRDNVNAAQLYDTMWSNFETPFWSEEQRRGRLKLPRLEWFLQTVLQSELLDEVDVGRLYVAYRHFATGRHQTVRADEQLAVLSRHAEHYRQLIQGTGNTPIATFGRRVANWDASTTHSLALLFAARNLQVAEQNRMFSDIVSYLVRRAVCGLTTKNYNKIFVQQMKRFAAGELTADTLRQSLGSLQGDASRWPSDDEFRASWQDGPMYDGHLDSARTKVILAELETAMRSARTEEPLPNGLENLDIDHILPTSWFEHWPLADGSFATEDEAKQAYAASFSQADPGPRTCAILRRENMKVTLGNLTLLHYGVNRGLKHHRFARKREALFNESNLHLNRSLMQTEVWNEESIENRSRTLFEIAKRIWPGPPAS